MAALIQGALCGDLVVMTDEEAIRREIASIARVRWPNGFVSDTPSETMRFCWRVSEHMRERDQAWRMIRNENAKLRGEAFYAQMMREEGDVIFNFCESGNPHHHIRCEKHGANGAISAECARAIVEISVLCGGEIESCVCNIAHDVARLWALRDELAKRPVRDWRGAL